MKPILLFPLLFVSASALRVMITIPRLLIASLAVASFCAAAERPNIVVILSDDYGYGSAIC